MTTVFIVSDVRLYRDGLVEVLSRYTQRLTLVGAAGDASEALLLLQSSCPNVVLIDLAMHDALNAIRAVREQKDAVRVIALGVAETDGAILECAVAGAAGYVCRGGSLEDLVATIDSAERDEFLCTPKAAAALLRHVREVGARQNDQVAGVQLTRRELMVMSLAAEGLSNKDIAKQLQIRTSTVKNHVHSSLEKLDTHHRREAVAKLLRAGILRSQRITRPSGPDAGSQRTQN